jgi:hypothetical protein
MSELRVVAFAAAVLIAACSPGPRSAELAKPDPTQDASYAAAVQQLHAINSEAEALLQTGDREQASALITKAQPLGALLLSAPRPTLAAMEAVSDNDDLYGRLLLANRHYGWSRMFFQKNLARWTNWKPQTQETQRRRKLAENRITECDRQLNRE